MRISALKLPKEPRARVLAIECRANGAMDEKMCVAKIWSATALVVVLLAAIGTSEGFAACKNLDGRLRLLQMWRGDQLIVNNAPRLSPAELEELRQLGRRSMMLWGPTALIPLRERLSVQFKGTGGVGCRGLLYEVAPGRQVTSPGDGYLRVSRGRDGSLVTIRTDAPLDVSVAGSFEPAVKEGEFVLAGESLGLVSSSAPAFICVETRTCDGTILDPREWMLRGP